jgi:hypothetical protein
MGKPRKPRQWIEFLTDYPAEGEPQYRAGDVELLNEVFALRLVSKKYGKIREAKGPGPPRRRRGVGKKPIDEVE